MPDIERLQSGLIYKEDWVDDNIMWQFFPNNSHYFEKNNNSITLKYSEDDTMVVTKMPNENFVLQCTIEHTPLSIYSFAGVILLKDNDSWVKCQLYKEDTANDKTYKHIKIMKTLNEEEKTKEVYTFYASINGIAWDVVGSLTLPDCNLIGFYFRTDNKDETITIKDIAFYKTSNFRVCNLKNIRQVNILNSEKEILLSQSVSDEKEVNLDLIYKMLPLQDITISMITDGGVLNKNIDYLYGGDVYGLHHKIKLKINGKELSSDTIFDLGHISNNDINILTIENVEPNYTIFNLKVSIEQHSSFNQGYKCVKLLKEDLKDTGEFSNSLEIERLTNNEPINILMKIDKDNRKLLNPFCTDGYKYKIILE